MKIHFIGIGGIGMSGIARLYLQSGHTVSGSDLKYADVIGGLEKLGAKIFIGHKAQNVEGAELVVYSSSIKNDHVEIVFARERQIQVIHRSEALARLCEGRFTIAVSGTHGKTTTTSLIGMILKEAEKDPLVVVGGIVKEFGGNARAGSGPAVIEADESDASFLNFSPNISVVTNIEAEHLDHFGNFENVLTAFRNFIKRLPENGVWIGTSDDSGVKILAEEKSRRFVGCKLGESGVDFWASDIVECPEGNRGISFNVWKGSENLGKVSMRMMGTHNASNALCAVAVGLELGINFQVIASALGKYEGARRRFDVRYEDSELLIVDDYAHHPTEIKKTLSAARAIANKRIVALFQPHRYSRTEAFLNEFSESFHHADQLIITDIYAASESPRPGISGEKLSEAAHDAGHPNVTFVKRDRLSDFAKNEIRPGDLVITLGAGDISQVASEISDYLRQRSLFSGFRGRVLINESLSRHTSLKIGGPVEAWVEPADEADLKRLLEIAKENNKKIYIFGGGSNILVADEGLKGFALNLGGNAFKEIRLENGKVLVRGGVPNALFIQFALEHNLGGSEFLSGIPGTIGGAVAMNAGSHGQSVDLILEQIRVMDFDGNESVLKKDDLGFGYRTSNIKNKIVLEATFALPARAHEESQKILDEYRQRRAKTQDLWHASAGCMFKNPMDSNCSSGKLIDDAGLKGKTVGRAQVSEKHANFIINLGGAKSGDIIGLIREVQKSVEQRFGLRLEEEVRYFSDEPEKLKGAAVAIEAVELPKKIVVLAGGTSCEREVSLVSGKAVCDALTQKGLNAILLDPVGDFEPQLRNQKPDFAFIALHGTFGEDGAVQKILDKEEIPYSGSGPEASAKAFDKAKAQAFFKDAGIDVADFAVLDQSFGIRVPQGIPFPLVVKPSAAGSSVGITLLQDAGMFEAAVKEAFKYSDKVLVEKYISGRELTVGILGDQTLPIVEIVSKRKFYDYQAKYGDSGTTYEVPAKIEPVLAQKIAQIALKAHRILGCEAMSRVDFILGEDGTPYLLEINTIPGLTGRSLLPKAAKAAGIDFGSLCVKIIELSLESQSCQSP